MASEMMQDDLLSPEHLEAVAARLYGDGQGEGAYLLRRAAAKIARFTRALEEAREEITRLRAQREAELRAAYRAGAEWTLNRIDEQTARARRAIAGTPNTESHT